MATKTKTAGDSSETQNIETAADQVASKEAPAKSPPSKYPAVRVLSGAELDAYKNQKVDADKAERFLAQKDKEEYWRNKKEQKRKKTED
jgi:hypothetical protein